MMKKLAVTGGAAGIGLALARLWQSQGGAVVLMDRSEAALAQAKAELAGGDEISTICCDITSRAQIDAAFAQIAEAGPLDALCNCAGIMIPQAAHQVEDADFARMIDIHVAGAMRCCRAAYDLLRASGGAIVNIASVAAFTGMPQRLSYCTAKAAIGGMTRTMAVEWAPVGIRVNAVAPGYVRTAMTGDLIALGKIDAAKIEARTPLGRFADPAEMAAPIAFLLSQGASYITGQILVVDGGMTIDGNWY